MTEQIKPPTQTANWTELWQTAVSLTGCEHCDSIFVLSPDGLPRPCPTCARAELEAMDAAADAPVYTQPPELMLPFACDAHQAEQKLALFAKNAWLAPADFKPERLHRRLQAIYLPMWLVDADVQAQWRAEMGFDYQVVSHKEEYHNGNWHTREVKETRVRWEPRAGTLQRHYDNRRAPALEEQAALEKRLGRFETERTRPYTAEVLAQALVRLPNRPPDDAWPDAQLALMQAAAAECRQAAAADHVRQYTWQPAFQHTHWSQLLLPLYTTFYTDDDGRVHTLYIHGQTGRLAGRRLASMKQARKWSLRVGAGAAAVLALTLLVFLLGFLVGVAFAVAGVLFMVGMLTAVIAFIPLLYAWYTNQVARDQDTLELTPGD